MSGSAGADLGTGGAPPPAQTPTQTPATGTQVPATPAQPWHQGAVDGETLGFWQNKGWDVNSPTAIATALTKAYRDVEKFVGMPPNEVIRYRDGDQDLRVAALRRLGAADKPEAYDLTGIKHTNGNDLPEGFVSKFREFAAKNNVPVDMAKSMAQFFVQYDDSAAADGSAQRTAALAQERDALNKNWGSNFETNRFIAQQAVKAFGVDPSIVNALENQVGYAKTMEFFRAVGQRIGEDRFVSGSTPGGPMTVDQASAQKRSLMSDQAWAGRFLAGGAAERQQMLALDTIIANGGA